MSEFKYAGSELDLFPAVWNCNWRAGITACDLMKVDIESAEYDVIYVRHGYIEDRNRCMHVHRHRS